MCGLPGLHRLRNRDLHLRRRHERVRTRVRSQRQRLRSLLTVHARDRRLWPVLGRLQAHPHQLLAVAGVHTALPQWTRELRRERARLLPVGTSASVSARGLASRQSDVSSHHLLRRGVASVVFRPPTARPHVSDPLLCRVEPVRPGSASPTPWWIPLSAARFGVSRRSSLSSGPRWKGYVATGPRCPPSFGPKRLEPVSRGGSDERSWFRGDGRPPREAVPRSTPRTHRPLLSGAPPTDNGSQNTPRRSDRAGQRIARKSDGEPEETSGDSFSRCPCGQYSSS